jgi:uncharacterized protein (DUF427 family)
MANPAPGYASKPEHRVDILPETRRVRVTYGGAVIADSRKALRIEETGHGPVHYLPEKDVRTDLLRPTEHSTHCPFKGDASYFSLKNGPENAVWSYEQPYDELLAIKDLLAFYPDKVAIVAEKAGR